MAARPPNILWILTTQWRAQATSLAGDPNARTPALASFAAGAVDFRQAVTPHPFGPFARAALLTGVACPQNGVRDYFDPLPAGARTIAHALGERGYATAFFGKWHLGRRDPAAAFVGEAHARAVVPTGERGGFGFWEGFESGFLLNDPWLHGTALPQPVQFRGYQPEVLAGRLERWWREQAAASGGPWFCVLSLETPHPPYGAGAGVVPPRDPGSIDLRGNVPRGGSAEIRARRELAGYYAHIEATDACLGRLLASPALEGSAAVVFTSVHGDMHGSHGLFRKGWPHEESVRVPLLVRAPGGEGAGSASDAPVSLLDIPEMAGAWAEGRAWKCDRNFARISMPSVVGLPDQCDRAWRGVRTPARKFVWGEDGAPWMGFDLERDPGEERNLAADPDRSGEWVVWRGRA